MTAARERINALSHAVPTGSAILTGQIATGLNLCVNENAITALGFVVTFQVSDLLCAEFTGKARVPVGTVASLVRVSATL